MLDRKPENSGDGEFKKVVTQSEGLDREELLNLLTMHYIERVERGENPALEEYTAIQPELAGELKANIAHYWLEAHETLEEFRVAEQSVAYQVELVDRLNDPQEQERARQAVSKILGGVSTKGKAQSQEEPLESLYRRAREKKLTPPQLARKLGITSDIMMALEQRMVNLAGIPRRLVGHLSEVLEVSNRQLLNYLGSSAQASAMYQAEDKPAEVKRQDFADYVRQSRMLKPTEKDHWLKEVETGALSEDNLD
jgi:transcriptional regulator with XRE-family HTH domain